MYTNGYRWDETRKQIIQTGVISIDVSPNDALVYLDEELVGGKLPLRITGKLPGNYSIRIEKEGYKSIKYNLEVHKKKASYLRGIHLIKNIEPRKISTPQNATILKAIHSTTGDYYALVTEVLDNTGFNVYLFDTKKDTFTLLEKEVTKVPDINWSPFANHLSLTYTNKLGQQINIFNSDNINNKIIHNFSFKDGESAITTQWQQINNKQMLIGKIDDSLYNLSEQNKSLLQQIKSPIWYVDSDGDVWEGDTRMKKIHNTTNKRDFINVDNGIKKIIDINKERAIFEKDNGLIVYGRETNWFRSISGKDGLQIRYQPIKKNWFVILPSEIWIIEVDGRTWPINRFAGKVEDVVRMNNYSMIVFTTKKNLSSFHESYYIANELYEGNDIEEISVLQSNNTIFFTDRIDGELQLFEMNLSNN